MKFYLFIVMFLVCNLYAVELINESFASFPHGWTTQGVAPGAWISGASNLAGGTSSELKLFFEPSATGTHRFVSPAFDSRGIYSLDLSYRQMLDDYANTSNPYSIGVQFSSNGVNWTTVDEQAITASIPAEQKSLTFMPNGGSANSYIAFFMEGNNFDLNYWCIDDVLLTINSTLGVGEWASGDYDIAGDLIIPYSYTLTLAPGTHLKMQSGTKIIMQGNLIANGTFANPILLTGITPADTWNGLSLENNSADKDSTILNYVEISHSLDSGIIIESTPKIRISNCVIDSCSSGSNGGGICINYSSPKIEHCSLTNNSSLNGGGISLWESNAVLEDLTIRYNTASTRGAGIRMNTSSPTISNSIISENIDLTGNGVIYINQYSYPVFSNCDLSNNNTANAMTISDAIVMLNDCTIDNNASLTYGSAINLWSETSILTMNRCNITGNNYNGIYGYGTVNATDCTISDNGYIGIYTRDSSSINLNGCRVINNLNYGIYIVPTASLTAQTCIIANNADIGLRNAGFTTATNSIIVNNSVYGIWTGAASNTNLQNCIIWGNNTNILNMSVNFSIRYSCLQNGSGGIGGTPPAPANYVSCIQTSPLFVAPTAGIGISYPALSADWHLQITSPCIDTGDPALPLDIDGSISDMGVFPYPLKPIITTCNDVYPDQGHQISLIWQATPWDTSFIPGSFYTIWRQGSSRDLSGTFIDSPALITSQTLHRQDIYWRDGDRTWFYLNQIPALAFADYGYIVPTLQDSSSTGTHAATFMVIYHNASGYWSSAPCSGYSVDNIPPDQARAVTLQKISGSNLSLNWRAVTNGNWEGNTYPEVNTITYKIYWGNSPDFEPDSLSYLGTTTSPTS